MTSAKTHFHAGLRSADGAKSTRLRPHRHIVHGLSLIRQALPRDQPLGQGIFERNFFVFLSLVRVLKRTGPGGRALKTDHAPKSESTN